MTKTAAILISHGHSARGVFQTNLLRNLKSQDFDISLIIKGNPPKAVDQLASKEGFQVQPYHPNNSLLLSQRIVLRSYIYQNIRNNPALWEKHLRRVKSPKISFRRKLVNHFYLVLGDLTNCLPFLQRVYSMIEEKWYHDPNAARVIDNLNPKVLISMRPADDMEAVFLKAAKKKGICRISYILSWDNITSKGMFPEVSDFFFSWGPIMSKELQEYYGIDPNKIFTTGVTHFDIHYHIKRNFSPANLMKYINGAFDSPYMLFTMSDQYFCPNEIDIIEWLANEISSNSFGKDMKLVIRPHMHNLALDSRSENLKSRIFNLQSTRIIIDLPQVNNSLLTWYMEKSDMEKLSNLLAGASICLNSGSTIAIEAAIMNRPVILTLFDTQKWPHWQSVKRIKNYVHLKKFIALNGATVVGSLEELESALRMYLADPNKHSVERQNAVFQECYRVDGCSTDRFVDSVAKLMVPVSTK